MKDYDLSGGPEKQVSCGKKAFKMVKRRLPILGWIRKYTKKDFISDLIAGVTVGLTVVPQSMAYAAIAGLSPEYGLYSSYIGVLTYVLLGSCAQATIGPTAVMGLLTFQTCGQDYPSCAILTGFYSGIFELLLAVLRLGWVVSFISEPVTVGFTAGAAMTIISSQVKSFLGIYGPKGSGFIGYWQKVIEDFTTIHAGDAVMGITSFIALMLLRKLKDVNHKNKVIKTALWLISLSRNVIVIIITTVIASVWKTPPFKLVGNVQGGFPQLTIPPFLLPSRESEAPNYNYTIVEDGESGQLTFWESWSLISTGPLVIALISILQNVAISKAFGSGQKVDATQEMIALGTSSVIGAFFRSIPTSASFSRSAVNEASGVRTPLGGLFTGVLVILSLGFLTPSFYYIPKASLAAVIIAAVMFMIEYESVLPMWRIAKIDAIACLITFVASLFLGMEYGILVGVGISVGALLLKSLKPELVPEIKEDIRTGIRYLLITPSTSGVNFPSVDHISSTIQKLSLKHKTCRVIVLNFSQWTTYDYTAANTLLSLVKGMKKNGKIFVFTDCSQEWVTVLQLAGMGNPPTVSSPELSDYLVRNIQPVIALDLGLDSGKCVENGGGIMENGVRIIGAKINDRDLMHRSNPSLSGGESSASENGSEATTTNSAKGLV